MRVACPECEAQYEVPDRLIGTGRRLRCARCDHDWLVRGPAPPDPGPEPPPMPTAPTIATPPPAEAAPAPSREGQDGVALWLAWVASVAAAMAAGVGVWLYRAPLAEFWPPLQRLL